MGKGDPRGPPGAGPRPRTEAKRRRTGTRAARKAGPLPDGVVVKGTSEIDAKDPLASGASAPLRAIWIQAARQARDERKVVIDLVGEGRGVIAIPVAFDDERAAMEVMTPALDALVTHCAQAPTRPDKPVMVDLQELRERLKGERGGEWMDDHGWFKTALETRELLCMYVFSPAYLFEFAHAIGENQGFKVAISSRDPGLYELAPGREPGGGLIVWNWARAIGDVILGGHAWSYFGMLLALAPEVAKHQQAREGAAAATESEEE